MLPWWIFFLMSSNVQQWLVKMIFTVNSSLINFSAIMFTMFINNSSIHAHCEPAHYRHICVPDIIIVIEQKSNRHDHLCERVGWLTSSRLFIFFYFPTLPSELSANRGTKRVTCFTIRYWSSKHIARWDNLNIIIGNLWNTPYLNYRPI